MRVLLIEDEPTTSKSIEIMLTGCKMNVYATASGEEGMELAKVYEHDIILLDLSLPDTPGEEVLRQLRSSRIETPVLIISGNDEHRSIIKGLGAGADDYLTKPFHRKELVARIRAIVRRAKGHAQAEIRTGQILVNLESQEVLVHGKPVELTAKEYQILELLSLRKGKIQTKVTILNHLYGGRDEPEIKIIDVFICKLRKKLAQANGGMHHIETIWGRGYVLRDPAAEEGA